jgi:N utilization substance protein B
MGDVPGPAERHAARAAALQMLYQWEVGATSLDEVLASYPAVAPAPLGEGGRALAERLVLGTARGLARIDPLIAGQAEHWRLERMPAVDRMILRLAIHELLERETPVPVVIDEALELTRTYSNEAAVGFVNGVLDAVAQRIRRGEGEASPRS